jgi:hypothetical protein
MKVSYRKMIRKLYFLPHAIEYLLSIITCEHGKNSYTYSVGKRQRYDLENCALLGYNTTQRCVIPQKSTVLISIAVEA